jgi:adenine phosphoribosyltransferase
MLPSYLKLIDTQTTGGRNDVLPLFKDHAAFSALVKDIAALVGDCKFDYVAGIDALGFILGTALALHFEVGFVGVRKAGKLPKDCDRLEFTDYTNTRKGLELAPGTFAKGDAVLLVDEWIETGAQVRTAAQLIENQGAFVSAITGIAMEKNSKTQDLFERYKCLPLSDGRIMGI